MFSIAQTPSSTLLPAPHPLFGRAVRVHRGRPSTLWRWWLLGAATALSAVFWFLHSDDPMYSDRHDPVSIALVFVLGVGMCAATWWRGAQRLVAYEGGFVWWRPIVGAREVPWRDVRKSTLVHHYSSKLGQWDTLDLTLASGQVVSLHSVLEDLSAIGTYASSPAPSSNAASLAQTLRAGGTATLGALTLSQAGITWRGATLAWNQIANAGRHVSDVYVDTIGPPPQRVFIPGNEVADPDVFLSLVALSRTAA